MPNERKDIYNAEESYNRWAEQGKKIKGLTKENREHLIRFLDDWVLGLNTGKGSQKGSRSFIRINSLRSRLGWILRELQKRKIKDVTKVKKEDLHALFASMRSGKITTRTGAQFKSVADYCKCFKTFWKHLQRTQPKLKLENICEDFDERRNKAPFVYFNEKDLQKIVDKAQHDNKPIYLLCFDAGCRVSELANIKVSNFSNDFKEVLIPKTKTFERKIKLTFSTNPIKEYITKLGLKHDNYILQKKPCALNKELRKLGKEVLSPEQIKYKNLSLYDFRHSSCCYWLQRYKSESGLKFRFGWLKSEMINYYSQWLGFADTLKEDDLYNEVTKTELEKQMKKLEEENVDMKNKMDQVTNLLTDLNLCRPIKDGLTYYISPTTKETKLVKSPAGIWKMVKKE